MYIPGDYRDGDSPSIFGYWKG